MRLSVVRVGMEMTFRELLRNRIALVFLFVIPTAFYVLVWLTTSEKPIAFKLASISEDTIVSISQRSESMVFIGLAAVGFLTAFMGLNLSQRDIEVNRRLVVCGMHPAELLVSKLGVLLCVMMIVGTYNALVLPLLLKPERFGWVLVGFWLGGWVYGCYGLLVGALVRRELEGILCIVLLANIDAGWLQNPIYYSEAQNTQLIRILPAWCPSQVALVAAFSKHSVTFPLLGSLGYGGILLALALLSYGWRVGKITTGARVGGNAG